MYDEVLEQETREQLRDLLGWDENSIEFLLADMRDEGAFDTPDEDW